MEIVLHVSDADYRDLVQAGRRMRGSIGLINPKEGTFNRHHPEGRPRAKNYRFCKLTHGRVSVTDERVRMTLDIDRSEAEICPADCIDTESSIASDFVYNEMDH